MHLTPIEIKRVPCPRCGAEEGQSCSDVRFARLTNAKYNPIPKIKSFHSERKELAKENETK